MAQARNTWKNFERRVAKLVRGVRISVSGQGRGDRDVEARYLSGRVLAWYQLKKRESMRATIVDWLDEIRHTVGADVRQSRSKGHFDGGLVEPVPLGALVVSAKGCEDANALVVLRLEDWARLVDVLEGGPAVAVGQPPDGFRATHKFRTTDGQQVFVRLPVSASPPDSPDSRVP